jgi:dipeptidyl aminopeptidase/acylaminoacyl peptidase
VRDVGAFLKRLRHDSRIDRTRMAVSGASYGGYMTLAALIRYP